MQSDMEKEIEINTSTTEEEALFDPTYPPKLNPTDKSISRRYYPHRLRDALSPVCGIFMWIT